LNLAQRSGQDFQAVVLRYVVERFLARLANGPHKDRFVLKGAMLFVVWKLEDKRSTLDLDLLGLGDNDPATLTHVMQEVFQTPVNKDGLTFLPESLKAEAIREAAAYEGVRIRGTVFLGTMSVRIQIDVGFGDTVVPSAALLEFPALLDAQGPLIHVYSPESVIAEKYHAMVVLGMANSRMKDYLDLWVLLQHFPLEPRTVEQAIRQTFDRRRTSLPGETPIGLSEEFAGSDLKQRQWAAFRRRQRLESTVPDLHEIIADIGNFFASLDLA
jgi:hypothetical protein